MGAGKNIAEEAIGEFQRFGKSGDRLFVARSAFNFDVSALDINFGDVPTGVSRPATVKVAKKLMSRRLALPERDQVVEQDFERPKIFLRGFVISCRLSELPGCLLFSLDLAGRRRVSSDGTAETTTRDTRSSSSCARLEGAMNLISRSRVCVIIISEFAPRSNRSSVS